MTKLSIIIVCYKGWARLTKCLDALALFNGKTFISEVIVVDNNSEDSIIFEIEKSFAKFKFIHNKVNGGFANGCNLGAKNSTGEYFLFLNPDTVANEQEVGKLLEIAEKNSEFGIVSCSQVSENGRESIACGQFPSILNLTGFQRAIFRSRKPRTIDNLSFPDWVSGSVIMIRKETFLSVKGFDEDFWMYFEDVDLCKRVRNEHLEVAFCRNISIEHNHGGSSRINIKTASLTKTEVIISRHIYISKHKKGIEKMIIQLFLVLNNLISLGLMAIVGLVLFFIPKLFSRTLIFGRLLKYYFVAMAGFSWKSPRSVNYKPTIKNLS
jgi:hypothetical protein